MTYNNDSVQFKKALLAKNLNAIKQIPKADLHNHSGLGMKFETFVNWCKVELPPPPSKMDGISGMEKYMQVTGPFVNSKEGFEFLLTATLEAAIEDGVTVIEPSIDCGWLDDYDNDIDAFANFILSCKNRFKEKLEFRPELGVFKGVSENGFNSYVKPCINSGIFDSIDFYGDEKWYQSNLTKYCFDMCDERGMKKKIHTGEFSSADSVKEIIEYLSPDELQHGINAAFDPYVMDLILNRNLRLNICPSSNIILGAVEDIKKHPIRQLFDHGIRVTLNTDDLLFFHNTVSAEFLYLYEAGLFDENELDVIRMNGLL